MKKNLLIILITLISIPLKAFAYDNVAGLTFINTNPTIEFVDTDLEFEGKLAGKLGFIYGFENIEFKLAPISLYDENKENSDGFAVLLRWAGNRCGFDFGYETTKGFTNKTNDQFEKDLESESYTLNFSYSLSEEHRLKSPAKFGMGVHEHGFIFMTSISRRTLKNDTGILDSSTQSQLGLSSNITDISANMGSLMIGYGYTGKTTFGLFSTIRFFLGGNFQRNEVNYSDGSKIKKDTNGSTDNIFFEIGYDFGDRWIIGSSIYVDKFALKVSDKVETDYRLNNISFFLKRNF
ncbi:MAG: DUF4421 domain-containing protein [Desulfobacterales bacterium]|nr:DUF4421 domain-containing protein [Desulfobacterales bacterium]MCP4160663.1 DUF4421 domain-containing protein [Deltaproteobacteria bacterium]